MASTDFARRVAGREFDARNEIARQDLATAMAEIFTPRTKGRRQVIETKRVYRGVTVRITGPELNSTDLGVLLALEVLAARDVSDVAPCADREGLLPVGSQSENNAGAYSSLSIRTTIASVAELLGRSGRDGSAGRMIRESLRYLMMVVVEGERGADWGANHLIAAAINRGGVLTVSLNYRATRAVIGTGQWAAIDMVRFRNASQIERVLMHRLAAHCTGGAPLPVSIDRLVEVCWTRSTKTVTEMDVRRTRIRDALPHALPACVMANVGANGIVSFRRITKNTQGRADK